MLEQPARFLLIGFFALSLASCAHFTSSGRAQLAYAHYVKKMSHNRVKVASKFKKVKVPKEQEAEPKMTGTAGGPQSVTSAPAGPQSTSAPEAAADRQPEASASPE